MHCMCPDKHSGINLKLFIMKLKNEIYIQTSPEKVFHFFEHMDEYYTDWHPDHSAFRWKKGRGLKPGVEFYFEEVIDGKLMKKTVRFTEIQPCSYIEFTPVWWLMRLLMPRLSFTVIDQGTGCLFIAEIVIRTGPAGTWLNRREFNAVQKHMAEEGQNLKTLLENLQKPDSPGEYS